MARPGFVLEVDERTPPLLFHHGEGFRLEKLPLGSRVIYAPEPLAPVRDVDATIAHALGNPRGSEPLRELLKPGMKLTIAVDDISLPLPPMRTPDIRGRVIEHVLELAARAEGELLEPEPFPVVEHDRGRSFVDLEHESWSGHLRYSFVGSNAILTEPRRPADSA